MMTDLTRQLKNDLEFWIRHEVCNRPDIGVFAFSTEDGVLNPRSNTFGYADCIAVAALLKNGYNAVDAAALVGHDIVYASPHRAGRAPEAPAGSDELGQRLVGIYRLAEGSLWSVFADNDIECVKPAYLSHNYLVVATRGSSIVDEDVAQRAKHLLTRCNMLGEYTVSA